jgi:hypothetical protein
VCRKRRYEGSLSYSIVVTTGKEKEKAVKLRKKMKTL